MIVISELKGSAAGMQPAAAAAKCCSCRTCCLTVAWIVTANNAEGCISGALMINVKLFYCLLRLDQSCKYPFPSHPSCSMRRQGRSSFLLQRNPSGCCLSPLPSWVLALCCGGERERERDGGREGGWKVEEAALLIKNLMMSAQQCVSTQQREVVCETGVTPKCLKVGRRSWARKLSGLLERQEVWGRKDCLTMNGFLEKSSHQMEHSKHLDSYVC